MTDYEQYRPYLEYIEEYKHASNAATGSKVDSNANVENKNITTMIGELYKKDSIGINRLLMHDKIKELYGSELADQYIQQLESHEIYKHDETSLFPYTYGAQEVVNVKIDDEQYSVSFKRLFELCAQDEKCLDDEKGVWAKYPSNMYIEDRNGFTKIKRLIKKKRHRDLNRVKLAFSNDIIVTDNHPMIINDNINDTIPASDVANYKQYRCKSKMSFAGREVISSLAVINLGKYVYRKLQDGYIIHNAPRSTWYTVPNTIKLDRELGYFVGFFIGDGDYVSNNSDVRFSQKDIAPLETLANIALTHFNAPSRFYYDNQNGKNIISIAHPIVYGLLRYVFNIMPYAQNKTLPEKIFEYNTEFARGLIEGLIDSDGTVESNGTYCIRISSRTGILQIANVINALGITTGCSTQQTKFGQNNQVEQKYQLFGVRFRDNTDQLFQECKKADKARPMESGRKGNFEEWQTVTQVEVIDNEPYLRKNEYIYDITTESNTFVCNGIWVHNCVSITMYPFLFNGLENIGGISSRPKNLDSFCGSFINLVFAIASQFAGAVSTPEFLMYMDYFIRKEYGDDYYFKPDKIVTSSACKSQKSIKDILNSKFQQVIYSMNQPAAARNFQSVFWNIAYFDEPYFNGLFDGFVFPDGTEPKWESVSWLQKFFMDWFNKERLRKVLTFPVETMNLLNNGEDFVDREWADYAAYMYSKGHSFFTYTSGSVDSLASCCRLKNELVDNTFSFTLGAGGVSTGSKGVMTININRLVQNAVHTREYSDDTGHKIEQAVREQVEKIHKYLISFNEIIKDYYKSDLLPIYNAGYIALEKQFLTIGINGFVEAAEYLGIDPTPNETYFDFGKHILQPIYELNKRDKTEEIMFNTEFVPAENLGVKNAKWDKEDGYFVPRDCYNSYFYKVEDESVTIADKFILHGNDFLQYLDGGSALHANLSEHLSKEQYDKILKAAIRTGCSYFTFNIPNTICNKCGHISKHMMDKCEVCGSEDVDYATRVIGYLKRVSKFSEARQKEASQRFYDGRL